MKAHYFFQKDYDKLYTFIDDSFTEIRVYL